MMSFKYNVCGKVLKRFYQVGRRIHRNFDTEYETIFEFESDQVLDSETKEVLIRGVKYEVQGIMVDLAKNSINILVNKIIREECDAENVEKFIDEFIDYVEQKESETYRNLVKFLELKYPRAYRQWINRRN